MTSYFDQRMAEINAEHSAGEAERAAKMREEVAEMKRREREYQPGYVYFYRAGNSVKIGFSTNPRARSHNLGVGSPEAGFVAKLVGGTIAKERYFHKRFAEYHIKGEWFDLRGALAKYLERHIYPVEFPAPRPVEERIIVL